MKTAPSKPREMMSILGKILISISLVVLSANATLACECKAESPSRAIKRLRKTATVIFVGTVTEVRKEVKDYHIGYWATFSVQKSWKSNDVDELRVFTDGGCMAWFETGRTYIVYARPDSSNRLSTNVCMRTGLIEYAAEDLKRLGKPQSTSEIVRASQSKTLPSQVPRTTAIDQAQDKELLRNVEQFAGGGYESPFAWQHLMSHDRQKLIDDLNRISGALPADDLNRVLIAFTFCKMRQDYDRNRQVVLKALADPSPYKRLYGDWVVNMISSLLRDGDKDLLQPLFKASEWSDGAMATELASAYSEALLADPDDFLNLLVLQKTSIQDGVTELLRDNSLTPEQKQKIRTYLKTVGASSRLGPLAAQTLKVLPK